MRTGPNRGLSAGQEEVRPEEKVKKVIHRLALLDSHE